MRSLLRSLLFMVVAVSLGCGDTIIMPTSPGQYQGGPIAQPTPGPQPAPVPGQVARTLIEFRVNGNPSSVRVRYSTGTDGLAQVVTTPPYVNAFQVTADTLFLSLEATPISYPFAVLYPFLSVQIVANGVLFREATAADFLLNTIAVSGTWRR